MSSYLKFGDFLFLGRRILKEKDQRKSNLEQYKEKYQTDLHIIPLEDLVHKLSTHIYQGLRSFQVNYNAARDGPNSLTPRSHSMVWEKAAYPIATMTIPLLGAAILCFVAAAIPSIRPQGQYHLDNVYLGFVLLFTVTVIVIVSICLKKRSTYVMRSFMDIYPRLATVIRDDQVYLVDTKEVVEGDVILFESGDFVPADIRVVEAIDVKVDESAIREDEKWRTKNPGSSNEDPLEADNLMFYGTYCVQGRGKGIAIATGERTLMAEVIHDKTALQQMQTPLQREVGTLVSTLGYFGLFVAVLLFGFSFCTKFFWLDALIYLMVMSVVTKPDILKSAFMMSLITAAQRMVSKKCLVKDLEIVEKVGSTSVICCDKTDVLTEGKFTLTHLWLDHKIIPVDETNVHEKLRSNFSNASWRDFIRAVSLCSSTTWSSLKSASTSTKYKYQCDRMDAAIVEFLNLAVMDLAAVTEKYRKVFERPFNYTNKYNITIHEWKEGYDQQKNNYYLMSIRGAPEVLLGFCSRILLEGKDVPKTYHYMNDCNKAVEELMSTGLGVIGFCDAELPKSHFSRDGEFQFEEFSLRGLRFLGLIALRDPLRPLVEKSIKKCREAGIKVVLVTGDHPMVAEVVARQVGIISPKSATRDEVAASLKIPIYQVELGSVPAVVIEGKELQEKTIDDVVDLIASYPETVFARLNPTQKLLIVQAYQKIGHSVAVTGNAVQAAKALKIANVGFGIGVYSCDFCLDCSDVVLLDDSFDTLCAALQEGRLAMENIEKLIIYALTCTGIMPFLLMILLLIPLPMGTVFLLLIFLLTDKFPLMALSQEMEESHLMKIMPRKIKVMDKSFLFRVFQKCYCQIGIIKGLAGLYTYLVVMAESGFLPNRLLGVSRLWYSKSINDLTDSYQQEWTYTARRNLEYTGQTAFFVSVLIVQWFTLLICRTRRDSIGRHSLRFIWWLPSIPFGAIILGYDELCRYIVRHSHRDFGDICQD